MNAIFEKGDVYILKMASTLTFQVVKHIFNTIFVFLGSMQLRKRYKLHTFIQLLVKLDEIKISGY